MSEIPRVGWVRWCALLAILVTVSAQGHEGFNHCRQKVCRSMLRQDISHSVERLAKSSM